MLKFKFAFALLAVGCAGAVDQKSTGNETSTIEQKLQAAEARGRGPVQGDPCATHGWYGDGVCDTFCVREDTDCVPKSETPVVCAQFIEGKDGVCGRAADDVCRFQDPDCDAPTAGSGPGTGTVCALYIETPDGKCSRKADDPCKGQDPDCSKPNPGTGGSGGMGSGGAPSASGGSTGVCAQFIEMSDGVCKRAADDACRFQDPDCTSGAGGTTGSGGTTASGGTTGGGVDCDTSKITCQTFAAVTCPDGKVPSVVNNCYGECVDKASCDPGHPPDGSGGSTGGGAGVDCDASKVTCQTFAPVTCPDGQVPSIVGNCYGPCVDKASCAPSSGPGHYDCLPEHASGQTPPECPKGQVPRIENGKYGACVDKMQCEPMACLAYIENSDGVCKRLYNDPCRGQDPDCSAY